MRKEQKSMNSLFQQEDKLNDCHSLLKQSAPGVGREKVELFNQIIRLVL